MYDILLTDIMQHVENGIKGWVWELVCMVVLTCGLETLVCPRALACVLGWVTLGLFDPSVCDI